MMSCGSPDEGEKGGRSMSMNQIVVRRQPFLFAANHSHRTGPHDDRQHPVWSFTEALWVR